MPYLSLNLLIFGSLFRVCLVWHTIGIYHSAVLTYSEPHHHHNASSHHTISKLMHNFYQQHLPFCKHSDPWDIKHLLSLLDSWTPASLLTHFKLAWKTATLLALVNARYSSDLILLCIDHQHLLLHCHAVNPFLHLVVRWINWVIFLHRFVLILIPVLIFALSFIWKLTCDILYPF